MGLIVLERAVREGFFDKQYDHLREELEAAGHSVKIHGRIEARSAQQVAREAWDLTVQVSSVVDVTLVVSALAKHLRGRVKLGPRKGKRRLVAIVNHRGETLKTVELPDDPA